MEHLHLKPTRLDAAVARTIAHKTSPAIEHIMKFGTWLADERLLYAGSALLWLASRRQSPRRRAQADHFLLAATAANLIPHLVKHVVDRQRPDRRYKARRNGIPKSGRAYDSFPSGHAMHVGVIASAASWMQPKTTAWVWAGGTLLATTRVALLAHWVSDVAVGLVAGAALERALRPVSAQLFGAPEECDDRGGRR